MSDFLCPSCGQTGGSSLCACGSRALSDEHPDRSRIAESDRLRRWFDIPAWKRIPMCTPSTEDLRKAGGRR